MKAQQARTRVKAQKILKKHDKHFKRMSLINDH